MKHQVARGEIVPRAVSLSSASALERLPQIAISGQLAEPKFIFDYYARVSGSNLDGLSRIHTHGLQKNTGTEETTTSSFLPLACHRSSPGVSFYHV
jgi:hypothetical protein